MGKKIKDILNECQSDIDELLGGSTRIIVTERKNNSTASMVFAKSSFAKERSMKEYIKNVKLVDANPVK